MRQAFRWGSWPGRAELAPYLVVLVLAALAIVGLAVRPQTSHPDPHAQHVLIAGAPGLRWSDLDPQTTPHLWQLAGDGAVGSLPVRSAHRPTCAADGWLTLGAGNWAADTSRPAGEPCSELDVVIETNEATGAYLPGREALVRDNRWQLPWGAVPGALAGSVECTTAVGDGGAVAAARVYGRVDRYLPQLPADRDVLGEQLNRCELGLIDLGSVAGSGAARAASVAQVDEALGAVVDARPPQSLLLVAGVAETSPDPHLHLVIGEGPQLQGGWLTSNTTRRTGYVQLVDLAPTALAAMGRPSPQVRLAGHPVRHVPAPTGDMEQAQGLLVAADDEAGRAQPVRKWFVAGLVAAQLVLFAAVAPLLRSHGSSRRAPRAPPAPSRWRRAAEVLLVAASMVVPAALVAGGLPWWRFGPYGGVFVAACLAIVAVVTYLLVRSRVFGSTLLLLGVCGALAALVVAADLLTGSRLQLNGIMGYSPHDAERFAGVGPVGAGVLMGGTLLLAGCVAQQVNRRWRPVAVVATGAVGVVLVGSTYLGAELGAALGLTAGVCVAAAMCNGGWLTFGRVAWATIVGLVVVGAVALIDLRRPEEERGGLGRMLTELADGTAGFGLQRASLSNWEAFVGSPLTLLAIGAGLFVWLALLRPAGALKRLFGIYPALRAAMSGIMVAVALGGVLTGAALMVAGAAAAVVVPLATVAALRLRVQAAARHGGAAVHGRAHQVLW